MRAEHAPVGVQLVDDDVAEVLEEHRPLRVMGQDAGVQHVGIGQHHVGARAHRPPRVLRRVAVVREHPQLGQLLGELLQLRELVLRERLRREEIERARVRLVHERLQHGQVVAERLAGRGRGDHDDMAPRLHDLPCACLVAIELLDAARAQRLDDPRIHRGRKRRVDGLARGEVTRGGDAGARRGGDQQIVQDLAEHRQDCIIGA
jgi:hypothetical protein